MRAGASAAGVLQLVIGGEGVEGDEALTFGGVVGITIQRLHLILTSRCNLRLGFSSDFLSENDARTPSCMRMEPRGDAAAYG